MKNANFLHKSFEIWIILKWIDWLLEIIWSILILLMTPNKLNVIVNALTQHEISEDPKDSIANYLIKVAHQFSFNTQHFISFYLFYHWLIKIILVILLLKKILWAYPLAIIFLGIFIIYQSYRYTIDHSIFMIWL